MAESISLGNANNVQTQDRKKSPVCITSVVIPWNMYKCSILITVSDIGNCSNNLQQLNVEVDKERKL
jgi:hypothetical protein